MSKHDTDFSREAAYHLRQAAAVRGHDLKSSTAHELVAGYFGFQSRAAMTATELAETPVLWPEPGQPQTVPVIVPKDGSPSLDDPFLHYSKPNLPSLETAVAKLGTKADLKASDTRWIAQAIQEGLVPACMETGEKSLNSLPVYNADDELVGFASPRAVSAGSFGTCHLCGGDRLYLAEDLNSKGLCYEHRHEFDLDPEEQDDFESFIEYHQNR